mmetsp:Transcript_20800/g.48278  ORF Transcript_20800/g.48278 Transcript_20800/m.48278 type:complete len:125 (-) Transcript_20800:224-598(-)
MFLLEGALENYLRHELEAEFPTLEHIHFENHAGNGFETMEFFPVGTFRTPNGEQSIPVQEVMVRQLEILQDTDGLLAYVNQHHPDLNQFVSSIEDDDMVVEGGAPSGEATYDVFGSRRRLGGNR